jgi:methyltransferase-like protein
VPVPVREKILDICVAHLSADGLGYVSYNCYPGWHVSGLLREMMLYHAGSAGDPQARVRDSRALLELLARSIPDPNTLYSQTIRQEAERLRTQSDSYLLHEHLEDDNDPVYFHEFVARVDAKGLVYVGDARLRTIAENQPPDVQAVLDRLSTEYFRREQYHDFLRNRTFRRSILAPARHMPRRSASGEGAERLRVLASVAPMTPLVDIHSSAVEEFRSPDGQFQLKSGSPLVKATLVVVCESWPRSVPLAELHNRVLARLDQPARTIPAPFDRSPRAFTLSVLQCHAAGLIEFCAFEPRFETALGTRPKASRLARLQAETGRRVVNMRHRNVELTEFERLVIRQLDGQRERPAILEALGAAVADGSFTMYQNALPIRDLSVAGPILARSLEPCLARLAGSALLEA